jgi:hypothetical protein
VTNRAFPPTIAFAMALLLAAAYADAQGTGNGNGRPKAPKSNPAPTAPSSSSPTTSSPASSSSATSTSSSTPAPSVDAGTTNPTASIVTFRQFGAWLDDASAATPGEGYVSIGTGYWRMPGMSQINVPMLGGGVGVTDRVQVSATVPFYNVQYEGGSARGLDDVYLGAKYVLVDPTLTISEFGLAVSPVVEVLSPGAPGGRVHFAIPVSMELRRAPFRMYGSAGYFTRGSVFTAGALEWTSSSRFVVTGMLTQSYSVKADPVLDSLSVGRRHVDAMASAAYPLGTLAVGYASIGRSLSSLEEGGTSLALTGGISLRFQR